MNFATKKAAKAAGYKTAEEFNRGYLVPRRDAEPSYAKGTALYEAGQCEELVSRTEARRRELRIPKGLAAVCQLRGGHGQYPGFRVSDLVPPQQRVSRGPVEVGLLEAIFTVNRAAKRRRDGARSHYAARRHGFARHQRLDKDELYSMKDAGISEAVKRGLLGYVGRSGGLALYRGNDYCFHSTLIPTGKIFESSEADTPIFRESRPRENHEPRLKDAIFTLQRLADVDSSSFCMLEMQ